MRTVKSLDLKFKGKATDMNSSLTKCFLIKKFFFCCLRASVIKILNQSVEITLLVGRSFGQIDQAIQLEIVIKSVKHGEERP